MILGAWFWRWFGRSIVEPFDPGQISPASYDVSLGNRAIFYRFKGVDLPGLRVELDDGKIFVPVPGEDRVLTFDNQLRAGDIFLAETAEFFRQPRGISLSLYLKSSTARSFLEHLHAGWGEHGFHGRYTLEFKAVAPGRLYPGKPIGQMVAHATLGWHSYRDKQNRHYQNQSGVTPSLNDGLAWRPWWKDPDLCEQWRVEHGIDLRMRCNHAAAVQALEQLMGFGWRG